MWNIPATRFRTGHRIIVRNDRFRNQIPRRVRGSILVHPQRHGPAQHRESRITGGGGSSARTRKLHRAEAEASDRASDELAICRGCYEAAARFGRLSGGHPVLFDLEQLR